MPDVYLSDQTVALGGGNEAIYLLFLLFLVMSFFSGIALCINGVRLLVKERLSLAHVLPIIFGAAAIMLPILYALMLAFFNPLLGRLFDFVFRVSLYIPGMVLVFLLYSFIYAVLPKQINCGYIIVLGAGLVEKNKVGKLLAGRLEKAIQVFNTGGRKAKIIVSGGQGKDELVSEAFAMKNYLMEKGIHDSQIIMEDKSRSTLENMLFSKRIIENNYNCIFVTSNYHVLRAAIHAKNVSLNAQGVGGKTALYYLPAAFIRECTVVMFTYKGLAISYILIVLAWSVSTILI